MFGRILDAALGSGAASFHPVLVSKEPTAPT
jgi:hypothetical protein